MSAWQKGCCVSSCPLETPVGGRGGPGVLGVLRGCWFLWLFADSAMCGMVPQHSTGGRGLLPTPSPFPCIVDFIYSFSFAKAEKLRKSVQEWIKPSGGSTSGTLVPRALVLVFVLGMVLGTSALMLGVSIGFWY